MDDRETRRLYRSDTDKMICGVCGGIGEYFNVDPTLIRLLWAVLACSGTGVVAYFIAANHYSAQIGIADRNTIFRLRRFCGQEPFLWILHTAFGPPCHSVKQKSLQSGYV